MNALSATTATRNTQATPLRVVSKSNTNQLAPGTQPGSLTGERTDLFTDKAFTSMTTGELPDLRLACLKLMSAIGRNTASKSAIQAIPLMQHVALQNKSDIELIHKNLQSSAVLVDNDLMKVVLIRWETGKISSIHGHPEGGCVFKVLRGSVEELRYTKGDNPKLLASSTYQKDAVAYIDDNIGLHAVGNPFDEAAITLHVYTKQS